MHVHIVLVKKAHECAGGDITQMVCVYVTAATTRPASVSTANTTKHFQYSHDHFVSETDVL